MHAIVVHESAWGNTQAVADAVAAGLGTSLTTEVVAVADAPPLPELSVDLLVVGAPTQAFGLSRPSTREDAHRRGGRQLATGVREWIAEGSTQLTIATFDTHVRHPNLPGHAGHGAARTLRKMGCTVLADPETFYVDDYEGPLLPGELDRAREWGEELGRRLAGAAGSE